MPATFIGCGILTELVARETLEKYSKRGIEEKCSGK
jgi:hypothetical protein